MMSLEELNLIQARLYNYQTWGDKANVVADLDKALKEIWLRRAAAEEIAREHAGEREYAIKKVIQLKEEIEYLRVGLKAARREHDQVSRYAGEVCLAVHNGERMCDCGAVAHNAAIQAVLDKAW